MQKSCPSRVISIPQALQASIGCSTLVGLRRQTGTAEVSGCSIAISSCLSISRMSSSPSRSQILHSACLNPGLSNCENAPLTIANLHRLLRRFLLSLDPLRIDWHSLRIALKDFFQRAEFHLLLPVLVVPFRSNVISLHTLLAGDWIVEY